MNINNIESLTITLSIESDRIHAECSELGLKTIGGTRGSAQEALNNLIDDFIVDACDRGETPSAFVKHMYGGDEDFEGFDDWLREERHTRFRSSLVDAFCDAYPNVDRTDPFAHMKIPYHDWESEQWDKAKNDAYQGLIDNGKNDKRWRSYIAAVCAAKYQMWVEHQKPQTYKHWKDIGLPVLTPKKMESLTWEQIEDLAFG